MILNIDRCKQILYSICGGYVVHLKLDDRDAALFFLTIPDGTNTRLCIIKVYSSDCLCRHEGKQIGKHLVEIQ